MNPNRLRAVTRAYPNLRIAVVGDFCLDRYFEIDPRRQEISIETGLPVHNIVNVRCQPGGAGTILNNLVALGIGRIYPVGIAGEDGEGYELLRALRLKPGVDLSEFIQTPERKTFTYTKPLVVEEGKAPVELNRLDTKNWSPTPESIALRVVEAVRNLAPKVDALILLDQVDIPQTGVVTTALLAEIRAVTQAFPGLLIVADSRQGLKNYPPVCLKMNRAEFSALTGDQSALSLDQLRNEAAELAAAQGNSVFITLAEHGIVGADRAGRTAHAPALPLRGEIDIVGAGDSVTANLAASLAGGAELKEALEIASLASSIVIHQLGTTGTATVAQIEELWARSPFSG